MNLKSIINVKWKKPDTKGYMWYDSILWNIQNSKSVEIEITFLVARDWEEGGVKVITSGGRISFYGEGQVMELEGGWGCITLWMYLVLLNYLL